MSEPVQLFELRIVATGEVRDQDGNLVSSEPIETRRVVTAQEAAEILGNTEGEPQ